MKNLKLGLIFFLISGSVFAKPVDFSHGTGEYRFGPDTSENVACEIAEFKAREDAILKFFGEQIESITSKNCVNEDCTINDQIFKNVTGTIKTIVEKERFLIQKEGYRSCIVKVVAEVKSIKNKFNFQVYGKFDYVNGEAIDLFFTADRPGTITVFNYYGEQYHNINVRIIQKPNEKVRIKNLIATLPQNEYQSKEMLVFVFTKEHFKAKDKYTAKELENLLASIDAEDRRVIYRYVNIVRKK